MSETKISSTNLTQVGYLVAKGFEVVGIERENQLASFSVACPPEKAKELFQSDEFRVVQAYVRCVRRVLQSAAFAVGKATR